jgi:hypothetical protein
MRAAKRDERPLIARSPTAGSAGRTGSIRTIADGNLADTIASTADKLTL